MPEINEVGVEEKEQVQIRRALRRRAKQDGWNPDDLELSFSDAQVRGDDYYIPSRVPGRDAWQKAERLVRLEEAWNRSKTRSGREIVLVPGGVNPELMN